MKVCEVRFSPEADRVYKQLREEAAQFKIQRSLFEAINQKETFILADSHYGNPMPKNLIPQEYIEKYDVNNLFRIELPNFWRMFYTLINDPEPIAIIIDILDHKQYNKKFGYKS